jgi:16S rRNA processing protein RimM
MSKKRDQRWEGFVVVGEVTAPHGIHGAVRLYPTTDFPDRLIARKEIWVEHLDGAQIITEIQAHPPLMIMQLQNVATREQAESLRGASLYVPIDSLPALGEQEYYWFQLEGMTVHDASTHELIGSVQKVIRTGANQDVFEVVRPSGGLQLVPGL